MKIYVAARYSERDKVRAIYNRLESLGHDISHKWTEHEEDWPKDSKGENIYSANVAYSRVLVDEDAKGVRNCDVLLLMDTKAGGKGKFIEYGMALALSKPCIVVNSYDVSECMFYFHPNVVICLDLDSAISMLSKLNETYGNKRK